MKRPVLLLSLVLVVQLGLTLALCSTGKDQGTLKSGGPLLKLTAASIDTLQIDGPGDQGSIILQKVDGKWTLPGHLNAPADAQKVDGLLTTLLDLQRSWPVAETAAASKRFKVADDDFERRLQFKAGDKDLASLFLGSSPGYRKVHARLSGEPQVFDIPFSTYQASLKPVDWVDKNMLQVPVEQISAIDLPDCRLVRVDGQPQLAELGENEQTNAEQAGQLFDRLAALTVLDIEAKRDQPLPVPVELSIKLGLQDGKIRQYDFYKGNDAGAVLLQVSDAPYLYKVTPGLLKDLQETTSAKLIQEKPAATAPAEDQPEAPTDNPQG